MSAANDEEAFKPETQTCRTQDWTLRSHQYNLPENEKGVQRYFPVDHQSIQGHTYGLGARFTTQNTDIVGGCPSFSVLVD